MGRENRGIHAILVLVCCMLNQMIFFCDCVKSFINKAKSDGGALSSASFIHNRQRMSSKTLPTSDWQRLEVGRQTGSGTDQRMWTRCTQTQHDRTHSDGLVH